MKISCVNFVMCTITFYAMHCTADLSKSHLQSLLTVASQATVPEDGKLNTTQAVVKYGHSVEQYDVVTEDGYVLTVFRIPGEKPPVLLYHGLIASSDCFLLKGDISMAITLANEGYDVWIGNIRGNPYGRRHVTLNPDTDKNKFWDFSFHEIGHYDLAATIDFIRHKMEVKSISVIGHSQGTTAFFVLASSRPEYNERVNIFIALAPIAFMNNLEFAPSIVTLVAPAIFPALKLAGIEEVFHNHSVESDLITIACSKGILSYIICGLGLIYPTAGLDPAGMDPEYLSVVVGHFPCGTSVKCFEHYDQIVLRRSFAQFSYGVENMVKYGSLSPPEYDLNAVTTKVALIIGKDDKLATPKNAEQLNNSLPNVVHYEMLEPQKWGHIDFLVRNDMPTYLYPSILNLLEKYN